MCRIAIAVFMILMPHGLIAVRLQFLTSIPVTHTSKLTYEIQESLPVLNLLTKGNQTVKFELIAKNKEGNSAIARLPLDLTLTLKDIFIFLNVNSEELSFDPKGEKISVPLIQLSQLIDKTLKVTIDSQGYLVDEPDTFSKLFKQLPALKELPLKEFINEMFYHLFSLSGQELSRGLKIKKNIPHLSSDSMPSIITYEIVEIGDEDILAKMSGVIEPKKINFDIPFFLNEGPQKIEMLLSGNLKGDLSWKRKNSMIYTLNNKYDYHADLKLGDVHWTMQMSISHASSSSK